MNEGIKQKSLVNNAVITFRKVFYSKSLSLFLISWLILQMLNFSHAMPLMWFVISLISVYCFFFYLYKLSNSWQKYPEPVFRKKLFRKALIIRVVFVVFLYYFFTFLYGEPYELGASDAKFYDDAAQIVYASFLQGKFNIISTLFFLDISDMGYPLFLGTVYVFVFKSLMLGRIVNAIFGAWTCVLVYDLAKRNFGEQAARLAGIMTMLLPNLIYYTGLTLKETIMTCTVVAFVNKADMLLREKRIKPTQVIVLTLLGLALFFFRTVLGISMILALFTSVVIISNKVSKSGRRVFLGVWIVIAVAVIFSTPLGDSITDLVSRRDENQASQMQNFSQRQGGNAFAKYGSMGVFLPMILIAPFPTLVDTNTLSTQMMMSGAVFTRNVYAFFVFVALFVIYKKKLLSKYVLILACLSFYLLILASSGFALSERFHLPMLPLLIVLASFGITEMNAKRANNFTPYLVFIAIVIIGWNWFKLAGRGL